MAGARKKTKSNKGACDASAAIRPAHSASSVLNTAGSVAQTGKYDKPLHALQRTGRLRLAHLDNGAARAEISRNGMERFTGVILVGGLLRQTGQSAAY